MNTMVCFVAHGSLYLRAGDLCRKYNISPAMVTTLKKGIEALAKTRYARAHPFINQGGDRFFNELVVIDYLEYRDRLNEKNLAKTVPPYDPAAVRFALGEYRTPIKDDSEEQNKLDRIIELLITCNRQQQEILQRMENDDK